MNSSKPLFENDIKSDVDLVWVFSMMTGELFQISREEFKVLESYNIPLLKKPNLRGRKPYTGRKLNGPIQGYYSMRDQVRKLIDKKLLSERVNPDGTLNLPNISEMDSLKGEETN